MRDLRNLSFAVVGASGAVGREMLSTLEERELPAASLKLLASKRSAGLSLEYRGQEIVIEELTHDALRGIDIALFSAGGAISGEYGREAAERGTVVIDNSSFYRMEPAVPLIVPEVNADVLKKELSRLKADQGLVIANPNCSTIQLVVVLKPIMDAVGLKRIVVSTYQAVSGAGQKGISELESQVLALLNQRPVEKGAFPHQIAFNCLPHIGKFLKNGYSEEEMKVVNESRKILAQPDLPVSSTAVRVPVFHCHSESVNIETTLPITREQAIEILRNAPGVMVLDEPGDNVYPLAIDLAGSDATYVGRIRQDSSVPNGLDLWIVADNLRKGAALNAVQIAEVVIDHWGQM